MYLRTPCFEHNFAKSKTDACTTVFRISIKAFKNMWQTLCFNAAACVDKKQPMPGARAIDDDADMPVACAMNCFE